MDDNVSREFTLRHTVPRSTLTYERTAFAFRLARVSQPAFM
jgi:hypothetical protein